jgi:hypothetical protein
MQTVSGLIPAVWSASILRGFEKASVFTHCLSRLYQGDIKVGNVVKVPRIGAVSVRPYELRIPIIYDDIDADTIDIPIDQQTYFGLRCEDIERVQAMPDFLDAAVKNAAYALRDTIDTYTAEILDAGAGIAFQTNRGHFIRRTGSLDRCIGGSRACRFIKRKAHL